MKFITFVLLICASTINSQLIQNKSCPTDRNAVTNFDAEKYLGQWYEIFRYDQPFQKDGDCCYAIYTLEDDHIRVNNSMIVPDSPRTNALGRAYISFPDVSPVEGKLNVTFAPPPVPAGNSNYWILDTDYTNYAIIWSCFEINENKSAEAAWVLARDRYLSVEIQSKVDENIDKFFVREELRKTNQDENFCGY